MVNLINSKQLEYCLISVLGEEMLLDNITHVKSKIMCQMVVNDIQKNSWGGEWRMPRIGFV